MDHFFAGGIFPLQSPEGVYKYNLDQAKRACEERGAVLASYNRLYEAWQQGLSHCACGWLSDGTSRFPMQAVHDGCGSAKVNMCDRSEADAWCFRSRGVTFPLRSPEGTYKYNLDQAKHACEQQAGAVLATYDQLYEAWQQGLNYCACGWLSDGTSRYPMQVVHKDCGSAAKVNTCGRSVADAWCFLKYCK
ncbi:hyaluronan and proteoglycan link protein 3-like [Branchiostoma floridae]|uniref:Hyaluronan and proteoglycan link protein 3-like n=1 Tax=Branchiostoma floridae TaxID=7739 RepID=A0A9J7LJ93_BRAFL|nr:hyaluronan and proteoglycan link protein 3-like [Branchiostoma floridae]